METTMTDLFRSLKTREELANIYAGLYEQAYNRPAPNTDELNRGGLVSRIEELTVRLNRTPA